MKNVDKNNNETSAKEAVTYNDNQDRAINFWRFYPFYYPVDVVTREEQTQNSLIVCPFNPVHTVYTRDYDSHLSSCPDAMLIARHRPGNPHYLDPQPLTKRRIETFQHQGSSTRIRQ